MQKILRIYLLLACFSYLLFSPTLSWANESVGQSIDGVSVKVDSNSVLPVLQQRLDALKQRVSTAKTDKQFTNLNNDAQLLANDTEQLMITLAPQLAQVQAQLEVLGPAPTNGTLTETAQVVSQRKSLNSSKALLTTQIEQVNVIALGAQNLSAQIDEMRRGALKTQIALNTGTLLGKDFWTPLFTPSVQDAARFNKFTSQLRDA